jgi:hypothetical protein
VFGVAEDRRMVMIACLMDGRNVTAPYGST